MTHLVSASTGDLFDKVSPAPAPLNPTSVTHRPGTVVTMPWQNTDWSVRPPQHNLFYKVKRTTRDPQGREVCHLTQLIPAPFRGHLILNPSTKRWNKARFKDHHPLVLDSVDTQDLANSLTPRQP